MRELKEILADQKDFFVIVGTSRVRQLLSDASYVIQTDGIFRYAPKSFRAGIGFAILSWGFWILREIIFCRTKYGRQEKWTFGLRRNCHVVLKKKLLWGFKTYYVKYRWRTKSAECHFVWQWCSLSSLCWAACGQSCLYFGCLCVQVPLYLPDLGTQDCRNLSSTSPGRRNASGAIIYPMKLPLRAPPGHPEKRRLL